MSDKVFPPIDTQAYGCEGETFRFSEIDKNHLDEIAKLVTDFGHPEGTDYRVIKERIAYTLDINIYQVLGIFNAEDKLIGVASLWHMYRHYSGKSAELDHMYLDENYRGKGLGKAFMSWLEAYLVELKYQAIELNAYVANSAAHKLYLNMGYKIMGFHHVKRF